MRILMVRPYLEGGGATLNLINLAGGLVKNGHQVTIATAGGLWLSKAEEARLRVHKVALAPSTPLHVLIAAGQIRQLLDHHQIDLIHSHHRFAGLAARLAARGKNIPLVTTVHEYTTNFHSLTRLGLGDDVITFSQALKNYLVDHYHISPERISVVTMGVEQSTAGQFGKLSYAKLSNIGCIARLSPEKGVDILLQALARIIQTTTHKPHCTIVGDGPELARLKKQADRLNISVYVTFTEWQDNINDFIVQFNFLALPSQREGFGLVVLEGWRQGRPTIGSQVGGIAELIENGKTGLLVPPNDANALAEAILNLLENPNLARKMGERGRLETLPAFTIEKMVQETENIYAKL